MPPSSIAGRKLVSSVAGTARLGASAVAFQSSVWGASQHSLQRNARLASEHAALDAALERMRAEQALENLQQRRFTEQQRLEKRLHMLAAERVAESQQSWTVAAPRITRSARRSTSANR